MQTWELKNADGMARRVLANLSSNVGFPADMGNYGNPSITRMTQVAPGIFEVCRSLDTDHEPYIIVGGIHGDEKAGIAILDHLIAELPKARVRRNLLLIYGNLMAMREADFKGVRCTETEVGEHANLNRCFGHGHFARPSCYSQRRANEIMAAVENFVSAYGTPTVIDIHQSFAVPTLEEVRGGAADRSDYTYAIAYPNSGEVDTLTWFYKNYSDIVAAVVLNGADASHHTFAGYMARHFGARAATFEQGTIGYVDYETFVPQLTDNLLRKIQGETKLDQPEGFDVWRCDRGIRKQSSDFHFIGPMGEKMDKAPVDFLPLHTGVVAVDGDLKHYLSEDERLLFANSEVPLGDRAAAVVSRVRNSIIPSPV